jgi:hypothetical protein
MFALTNHQAPKFSLETLEFFFFTSEASYMKVCIAFITAVTREGTFAKIYSVP